jgi:tetratricopeptide (TPR) repeat protein
MKYMGDVLPLFASRAPMRTRRAVTAAEWYERGRRFEGHAPARARHAYARALALKPALAEAHVDLGRLLHEAGELGAAEGHYRLALLCRGDEPIHWYNLGVVLQDRRRHAEAIAAYRACLALDPAFADAHYNLGGVLERCGDMVGALRHLSAYRRLVPRKVG